MQITLGPQYNVGEVLGLDDVRNLLVYSTTQYYNTIVIKCIQYKYKRVRYLQHNNPEHTRHRYSPGRRRRAVEDHATMSEASPVGMVPTYDVRSTASRYSSCSTSNTTIHAFRPENSVGVSSQPMNDTCALPQTDQGDLKKIHHEDSASKNVLTFFPPDWGMLRRSRCFQIFL